MNDEIFIDEDSIAYPDLRHLLDISNEIRNFVQSLYDSDFAYYGARLLYAAIKIRADLDELITAMSSDKSFGIEDQRL